MVWVWFKIFFNLIVIKVVCIGILVEIVRLVNFKLIVLICYVYVLGR